MQKEKNIKKLRIWTLAFGIAFMPPIWAVLSPYIGVETGAVALICAGLYSAKGNKKEEAPRMIVGLLLGDLWAVLEVWLMERLQGPPCAEQYMILFILGGLAVLIGESFSKFIFLPAWLCGWAIGLTIMGSFSIGNLGTLPLQIGTAMVVGILYVGIGVDFFQNQLLKRIMTKKGK